MSDTNMTVAIEKAVHDAIAKCLQGIADDFGLQVTSVSAEWLDVSWVDRQRSVLSRIETAQWSRPKVE